MSVAIAGAILVLAQATGGLTAAMVLSLPAGAADATGLLTNGRFLAITTAVSAALSTALLALAVCTRGGGLRGALGLRPVPPRLVAAWLGATLGLLAAAAAVSAAFDHPPSAFVLESYRTADPRWLFWLAIVGLAPLSEELMFRGFLFGDLAAAGLRPTAAVLITTAVFAALHLGQYAPADFALVAALGLLLGAARARTGSVHPSIAMHVLMNGWALVGAALTVD